MSALPMQSGVHFAVASNPEQAFLSAIAAAGLTPPDAIVSDGKIHRFSTNGKRGDDGGWYCLHADNIPAGSFGNWREGRTETWCSIERNAQTAEQQRQYTALLKSMQNARQRAKKAEHDAAAEIAVAIWAAATPIDDAAAHAYSVKKGIQPHGARLIDTKEAQAHCPRLSPELAGPLLVIPMRNAAGELRSLQFISGDGIKRPLTGGEKQGCYCGLDKPDSMAQTGVLIVCEGFATGASIFEVTGQSVVIAFDRGNLEPVAKALRKRYPDAALIVAADDDWQTPGNPGRTDAAGAAKAVGGVMVAPTFPAGRPDKATDFNDLHQLASGGLDAVKACFAGAIESLTVCANDATLGGQTDAHAEEVCPENPLPGVDGLLTTVNANAVVNTVPNTLPDTVAASPFPGVDGRPRYVVLDDWTKAVDGNHRPGLHYCGLTAGKKDSPPEPFDAWICSAMHIDAVTFDGQSNNFGRLLRFKPTVGAWREWAMPMELLAGDGAQLRGELLAMGVELDPYLVGPANPLYPA